MAFRFLCQKNNYRAKILDKYVFQTEFGHKVYAFFPVIIKGSAGVDGHKIYVLCALAYCNHCDGFGRKIQGFPDGIGLEIEDEDAAKAHFNGFKEHTLGGDTKVDVHNFILFSEAASHDEGFRLSARLWKMLLRQGGTKDDVGKHLCRLLTGYKPVAQALEVLSGAHKGGYGNNLPKVFLRYLAALIIAPVTAVTLEEGVQGGIGTFHNRPSFTDGLFSIL